MKKQGIGLGLKQPTKKCSDKNCPFHSNVAVRGRTFTGTVVSDKMSKTVTVFWTRRVYVPKYERYERKKSRLKAHNPDCIGAKKGDVVKIAETRPLSKTKNFVVVQVIGRETKKELVKDEAIQDDASVQKVTKGKKEAKQDAPKKQ